MSPMAALRRSICTFLAVLLAPLALAQQKPFAIRVVDDQTHRGVPLVELKTSSSVRFYTDSAGYAAIDDPAMLGRRVFFNVSSHGYEFAPDGFGVRGRAIELTPGGEAELPIHRVNLAQRLYRLTGEGIYRDSVLLGKPVPITEPLLNGEVCGQDSAQCAVYRGKVYFFFGDTLRQSYALGQFSMSGATADLPGHGGLDPNVGVNLTYFVDKTGFSRPMVPPAGAELHWVDGVTTLKDNQGRERLVGSLAKLVSLSKLTSHELVVFNDDTGVFEPLAKVELKSNRLLRGQPIHHTVDGVEYLYFGNLFCNQRVKADWKSIQDPAAYEAYLPSRDAGGKWAWSWQQGAEPMDGEPLAKKVKAGEMTADDIPFAPKDVLTGRLVRPHYGSVRWNAYRRKFISVFAEFGGKTSFLGEIWYAEADHPEGPWRSARQILTHDKYSFYNPVHHDFYDADGGRTIYFEGTYTTTFSRDADPTPRYEYNQMMYKLDLADERLRKKQD